MAERALVEDLVQEQGETGRKTQRWMQPCMRQAMRREPIKTVKSELTIPHRTCKIQNSPENAARERSRVQNLRQAFRSLQAALPAVPPNTKLSKLDVLVLATNYIAHLTETLDQDGAMAEQTALHRAEFLRPVKKWPMRSLLYCGNLGERLAGSRTNQEASFPPKLSGD